MSAVAMVSILFEMVTYIQLNSTVGTGRQAGRQAGRQGVAEARTLYNGHWSTASPYLIAAVLVAAHECFILVLYKAERRFNAPSTDVMKHEHECPWKTRNAWLLQCVDVCVLRCRPLLL